MGLDPDEQEILRLLTKLKDAGGEYPKDMLAERRRAYLASMAGLGLAKGPGMGNPNGVKNARSARLPRGSGVLLETALIAVILAETSAVVYAYRHELVDFFQTNITDSRVEQAASPEAIPTSLEIQSVSPSPALSSTAMPTATGTPIPGIVDDTAPDTSLLSATPDPNGNDGNNGNNGNHYGQTPKPERTKENNGNGNNDKPPKEDRPSKEDKPPGDEPKPTKAK